MYQPARRPAEIAARLLDRRSSASSQPSRRRPVDHAVVATIERPRTAPSAGSGSRPTASRRRSRLGATASGGLRRSVLAFTSVLARRRPSRHARAAVADPAGCTVATRRESPTSPGRRTRWLGFTTAPVRYGARTSGPAAAGSSVLHPASTTSGGRRPPPSVVATDGTGAPRGLTPGPYQHHGVAWLRDSSAIIGGWAPRQVGPRPRRGPPVVPLDSDVKRSPNRPAAMSSVGNPDDSAIAFLGNDDPGRPGNGKVGVIPVSGGAPVDLNLDRTFAPFPVRPQGGRRRPCW